MERGVNNRQATFFAGSLVIFGAGALYGVRSVLRSHELKRLKGGPPFNVAVKALVYGTALCFGTTSLGLAAFISASGVTSWRDFHELAVVTLRKYDFLQMKTTDEAKEDIERMKALSPDEEAKYWSAYFSVAKQALKESSEIDTDSPSSTNQEE